MHHPSSLAPISTEKSTSGSFFIRSIWWFKVVLAVWGAQGVDMAWLFIGYVFLPLILITGMVCGVCSMPWWSWVFVPSFVGLYWVLVHWLPRKLRKR
jgi:hypothetical protein